MRTRAIEVMAWHAPVPGRNLPGPDVPSWEDSALCSQVGAALFFPERGETAVDARKVCARCRVTAECLEFAIETRQMDGVWGGTSERARRKMIAARNGKGLAA